MLSPILRTYTNPDENENVITLGIPHVMYYAPNISNKDVGCTRGSIYPSVILEGPHGYSIQLLGETERAAIIKEYEEMLSGKEFFRIHESHLINLLYLKKYIKGDGGQVILNDGSVLDVARRRKEDFLKVISNH